MEFGSRWKRGNNAALMSLAGIRRLPLRGVESLAGLRVLRCGILRDHVDLVVVEEVVCGRVFKKRVVGVSRESFTLDRSPNRLAFLT